MMPLFELDVAPHWLSVPCNDPRAADIYRRHYSYRKRAFKVQNVTAFDSLTLLTASCDALFVWRKEIYRRDKQQGVNCAIFRNESPFLASDLIREACDLAWLRWPNERLFTFVDGRKITSRNPGYCYKKAGWKRCGETKRGLIVLEILP